MWRPVVIFARMVAFIVAPGVLPSNSLEQNQMFYGQRQHVYYVCQTHIVFEPAQVRKSVEVECVYSIDIGFQKLL